MTKCLSITKLESLDSSVDILRVEFDNDEHLLMVFNYAESMQFLNQEVIYTSRKDIYKGEVTDFIATITSHTKVNLLDKESNFKLFIDDVTSQSNVSFRDIKDGETVMGALVYVVNHTYESSDKAVWAELTILDKGRHVAKVRLFDYELTSHQFQGQYVRCDLRKTKFGFNTRMITPMEGTLPPNPEVDIARKFILNTFANDKQMLDFLDASFLLDKANKLLRWEAGYELVLMAVELDLIKELRNIAGFIDVGSMARCVVLSRGYLLREPSKDSKSYRNMVNAAQNKFANNEVVRNILDETAPESLPEKVLFQNLKDTALRCVMIRKEFGA